MTRNPNMACGAALAIVTCLLPAAFPASGAAATPPDSAIERFAVARAVAAADSGSIRLVDVRPAGQRGLGHIRGDLHLPLDQIAARLGELPRDRELVFYCSCHAEETALEAARAVLRSGPARVGVLVGGYDAWRAAGAPIQVDATWENIFRTDLAPRGWGRVPVDSARCRYARDESVHFQGRASARIGCVPDSAARGFAGFIQRIDASCCRGREITFAAAVRSEKLRPGAFLWVGAEDSAGKMIAMTRDDPYAIMSTQEWRELEVTGKVPEGAARILIGVSLAGSGSLWLDDLRLTAPAGMDLPRIPIPVTNAGFEE